MHACCGTLQEFPLLRRPGQLLTSTPADKTYAATCLLYLSSAKLRMGRDAKGSPSINLGSSSHKQSPRYADETLIVVAGLTSAHKA